MTSHWPEPKAIGAIDRVIGAEHEERKITSLRKFNSYSEYENSGVDWLGRIPAHWKMKRLKNCVQKLESGGTPESDNLNYWTEDESGTPWVSIADMTRSFLVSHTAKRVTDRGLRSKRLPILPAGTLLYSMYASLGKVAVLEVEAVVNQAILGLVARDDLAARDFLRWWLEFMQGHVLMLSSSNTQDNLNADKVRKMPLFVPPLLEQLRIAEFLKRETARIDRLMAKKEQLLDLLQEQRTALINRSVTRGLDPSAVMKAFGVEWLREIPEHWETLACRRLISRIEQGWSPVAEDRTAGLDEWAVIKLSAVHRGKFLPHEHKALPIDVEPDTRFEIREGDFLLTRANTPDLVGDVCVARRVRSKLMLCDLVYRLQLRDHGASATFLAYWLVSPTGRYQIEVDARGASQSMVKVSQGHIRAWTFVLPPIEEQRAITTFLDRETAKIDALVAKVREAIDSLKELRTALISAAVTGKIDVREDTA